MNESVQDQCPICGAPNGKSVTTAVGKRFYCEACFHGWRHEPLGFNYSTVAMCSLGTPLERQQSQIAFVRPFLTATPRILEIGCAGGEFAAAMQRALLVDSYEAIELSPMGAKAKTNVDRLYTEPLRNLLQQGILNKQFDLIVMSHLLEHLADPTGEIRAISNVLSPSGVLFIEVPNRSGHPNLPLDDNIAHLHFFSPTSLLRLLSKEGLEAQAVQTAARLDARYADSLRIIARRFRLPERASDLLLSDNLLADADHIVVWGAGSVAQEILANFFDPEKIDFLIDSNPAKHGTICLGRPVISPEALGNSPRTILIASVDFAEEIGEEIARRYPKVGHRIIKIGDILDRGIDGKRR